jgi:hypothetical protein
MRGKHLLLAAGLGLMAQPVMAEDIVVKGKALSKEAAHEQASAYVQNIGIVTTVKPAARWLDPVCPKTVGIVDDKAAMVVARIRQVAANIGARVAKEGCRPNILVTFTDLGTDLIQRINSLDPRQLAEVPHAQRDRVLKGNDPIRWWYASQVRSHDGMPGSSAPPPWLNIETSGSGAAAASDGGGGSLSSPFTNSYRTSTIATQTKRSLETVTVVIDVKLAEGKGFDAVIDYAAMVSLAEVWPQGPVAGDSILSLFNGTQPPREITSQDEALLKALYKMPLDREGRYHRGRLVKDVSSALATSK